MSAFVFKILPLLLLTIEADSRKASTFLVSFQSGKNRSVDHWMRYNEKFEGYEKEFTACHWQMVRYFSMEINSLWAYCYTGLKEESQLPCIQLYFQTNTTSAGRSLDFILLLMYGSTEDRAIFQSIRYRHREWNHICVTFSSIHKRVQLFHNGNLALTIRKDNFQEIWYGQSIIESSFIIGQEPDFLNGGYTWRKLSAAVIH